MVHTKNRDFIIHKTLNGSNPLEAINTYKITVSSLRTATVPIGIIEINYATSLTALKNKLQKLNLLFLCPHMTSLKIWI